MGKSSLIDKIKTLIANIGFKLFLWANQLTQEEYWKAIYEQEKRYNQEKEAKELSK